MKKPAIDELTQAVAGLLYISETESELTPLTLAGDAANSDAVRKQAGVGKRVSVEEMTLDDFFRTVSSEQKPKYAKLDKVLRERLTDVKVFKVGDEPQKQVYVVGKDDAGKLVGVSTSVVET